jgi:hypothetical protein
VFHSKKDETMIENMCGSLASCQWLLHVHHHLMITFIKYMPHTFKCVYAISRVATFWQKKAFAITNFCLSVKTVFFQVEELLDAIATSPCLLNR